MTLRRFPKQKDDAVDGEADRAALGHANGGNDRTRDEQHRHATTAALLGGGMALVASFLTVVAALLPILLVGNPLFSGGQVLIAFGLLTLVVLAFFAFVFQRMLWIKAEGSRERGAIEIAVGDPSERPRQEGPA